MRISRLGCLTSLAVVAIVILGICAPAYGQTGDCYATLPGCLDPSFGVNGKVTTPTGMFVEGSAIHHVGGEARIVVVGRIGGAWAVARYRADGSLDASFGSGGIVQTSFKGGSGSAKEIVVQPDNKLVVVGYAPPPKTASFAVARYLENGSLDSSFGIGGVAVVPNPNGSWSVADAVALQSDGKIVATGTYNGYGLGVVRLNPNGTLDTGFNGDGLYFYVNGSAAGSIAIQTVNSNEYIVVGGSVNGVATVWRFTPEGLLDTTFSEDGMVSITPQICGAFDTLVHDSSNHRLLTVCEYERVFLVAYDSSGNLDPSFGVGGIATSPARLPDDWGGYLALQPDGRILVAGTTTDSTNTRYFAAWRFLSDGTLDSSFGSDGWVTTLFPDSTVPLVRGMVLQPDGKFVLAGYSKFSDGAHASLARYFGYLTQLTHDIAVYGISASPSTVTQGDTVSTQVTVRNNGTNAETADVTLTESPDGNNLGTQFVSLAPGETAVVTFTWLTSTYTTAGAHTLLATATITTSGVTDEQPGNNSRSTTVSVAPAGGSIVLSAHGYKVRSRPQVDLSWTGAVALFVDIYRNDVWINSTPNTGAYTEGVGKGTYIYKVCDAGTTRCSNTATVVF